MRDYSAANSGEYPAADRDRDQPQRAGEHRAVDLAGSERREIKTKPQSEQCIARQYLPPHLPRSY